MDLSTLAENPLVMVLVVIVIAVMFPQLKPLVGPVLARIFKPAAPVVPPTDPTPPSPAVPVPSAPEHPLLEVLKRLVQDRALYRNQDPKAAWESFLVSQVQANGSTGVPSPDVRTLEMRVPYSGA